MNIWKIWVKGILYYFCNFSLSLKLFPPTPRQKKIKKKPISQDSIPC